MINTLNEIQLKIYNFLKETNMNSNPDEWEKGFKEFKKQNKGLKITFKEFDDILTTFLNYYFLISLNYNFEQNTFGDFNIREKRES